LSTTEENLAERLPGMCHDYAPPALTVDEMRDGEGRLREHWERFSAHFSLLGRAEIEHRWENARRLIHDNGVTYNVYGDPAGMDRPWLLDAVPFIISAGEWETIRVGLIQRAQLLDAVIQDVYGPQNLLQEGLLPPELIFGSSGFLRPAYQAPVPANRWLHFYAADLGRGADGQMVVMGDRTQTPSGAGYALENRIVISRSFPDIFRACQVQRLAKFFRTMRETLKGLAPRNRENPRIVVLTPGPYNETYFEHAYLARYLGYTLVEGADLTVRDDMVYLKTLGGLQQVDVIVRRQDDDFCDPLELLPDSTLGVAGLMEAVHAGTVAVANALGTGVMETPAILAFLPALCQRLLGEDLKLQSAPTYWCGDPYSLRYVLEHLEEMVIKPTFPVVNKQPIFAGQMAQERRQELRAKIQANPSLFVGQRQITLSTTPVLAGGRMEPRHVVMRAHLVSEGESYNVMPGGLTRFSAATDSMVVSMQQGGGSKDTWVLSGGPVDEFSLLQPAGQAVQLSRAGGDLPSRVADNLFWLGRYLERAEGLARLARGVILRMTDQNLDSGAEIQALHYALAVAADLPAAAMASITPEDLIVAALLDKHIPHGMQRTLEAIYRIASLVRDRISGDTWRIVNRFGGELLPPRLPGEPVQLNEILLALDDLILTCLAFGGLSMESMTRGHAWRFQDMGRRIERSMHTARLLKSTLVPICPREGQLLEAVLGVADSAITYRRRYLTSLQAAPVIDLLLADETNPRSVGFQLAALDEHLRALPHHSDEGPGRAPEQRLLMRMLTNVRLLEIPATAQVDAQGKRAALGAVLAELLKDIPALSDLLSQSYLSHAIAARQMGPATEEN